MLRALWRGARIGKPCTPAGAPSAWAWAPGSARRQAWRHDGDLGLHLQEHARALLLAPFEVERALDPMARHGLDPWRCGGNVIWRKASTRTGCPHPWTGHGGVRCWRGCSGGGEETDAMVEVSD
jgi:hypothetical protein